MQRRKTKETEMRQDLIIQATELRKTYVTGSLKVDALRGVDFAVAPGEMVAIMGPSGSGKRALAALESVDLGDRAKHRPSELSGGQAQRVAVARALVNNPVILWADEPTGALDSESAEGIMDLLCELNQDLGQTVVLVTHALEVGERANRIVRMRDGRIQEDTCALDMGRRIPGTHLWMSPTGSEGGRP
jgi:ABC-type lipoprotein export system ATPase subunit